MELPDPDTIRILVTTDNHVGYNENDPVTGDDSWKTFHEVMMLAKSYNVDMVLQGGDLFHVNKPSKKSMYQVMKSLRLACMGDKPCELELLSDPSHVFRYNEFTNVNYEDPNFNISIPLFGIAGNHDDATGDSLLCPMDVLQMTGLVNHFGKVLETDKITVTPLLFQKGNTKLALYGLAAVRDERLFRTFKDGNVTFEVPTMREGEWFNLMCVHQNHTGHTNTAFLPEQFLPDFLDLVIWGHEHECIPHLVHNPTKQFDVLQPGSSVATSLCEAEAQPKNVFILEIRYDSPPNLIPIPLTTVRPFLMRSISLQDVSYLKPHDKAGITKYLTEQVEEMIQEANEKTKKNMPSDFEDDNSQLPLPLIRLRVDYSGSSNGSSAMDYQIENPRRFSNRFVGQIANSNNVVQFYKRRRATSIKSKRADQTGINEADIKKILSDGDGELNIQVLVNELLNKMNLSLLPEIGMNEAVRKFVDKDEKSALKDFIDREISNEVEILGSSKEFLQSDNVDDMKYLIKQVKKTGNSRQGTAENITLNTDAALDDAFDKTLNQQEDSDSHASDEIVLSDEESINKAQKRRKPGAAVTSPRRSPMKRNSHSMIDSIVISDEDDNLVDSPDNKDEDEDLIALSDDEEPATTNTHLTKSKTSSKRTGTRGTKSKATANRRQTPKTDALKELLSKKRH